MTIKSHGFECQKIVLTTVQIRHGFASCNFLLLCNYFPNRTLIHVITYNNRMTISDYNTKPVRGDRAIYFLNCTGSLEIARGSLEIAWGQLLNCMVVTAWA